MVGRISLFGARYELPDPVRGQQTNSVSVAMALEHWPNGHAFFLAVGHFLGLLAVAFDCQVALQPENFYFCLIVCFCKDGNCFYFNNFVNY